MEKLSNTEAELKKIVAYKKDVHSIYIHKYCAYYTAQLTL